MVRPTTWAEIRIDVVAVEVMECAIRLKVSDMQQSTTNSDSHVVRQDEIKANKSLQRRSGVPIVKEVIPIRDTCAKPE